MHFDKLKILTLILGLTGQLVAQSFEGRIRYQNTCQSSDPNFKKEYCDLITDSIQDYYFKKGNYKYQSIGVEGWTLYLKKQNTIYAKTKKSKTVFANKANKQTAPETGEIQINRNVITILGYPCDELILTTPNSIQKYYYHSRTSLKPRYLKKHKYGNVNQIIKRTRAIPLKTIWILKDQNIELISQAIEIENLELNDSLFTIPNTVEIQN